MKKISKDGLLLCKLQAEAFENSIEKMDTSSEIFIRRFMKSEIAKRFDNESVLESNIQANDVLELIKKHSRQYAKRQYTWFKNQFDVHWYDVNLENFEQTIEQVTDDIEKILKV